MIEIFKGTAVAMIALLLVGCLSGGASTDVVVGPDGVQKQISTLQTGYAPKDALHKATNVFDRLGLQRVKPQGYKPPGGGGFFSSEPKEWPIVSDAFSGVAYARTAANESIEIDANWHGQGATTIKLITQLPAPQHAHLLELIAAEMNRVPVGK